MPEQLELDIVAGKSSIYVFDNTGKYKVKKNECGWGSPNFRVSDISRAEVTFYIPCVDDPVVIDVYPSMPNDQCIGFEVLAEDLGLEEITSGLWKVEYRAYYTPSDAPEQTLSASVCKLLDDVVRCCIDSRKKNINVYDVSSEENKKTLELDHLLETARWAACKGDIDGAQKIMKYLNLQCDCCA